MRSDRNWQSTGRRLIGWRRNRTPSEPQQPVQEFSRSSGEAPLCDDKPSLDCHGSGRKHDKDDGGSAHHALTTGSVPKPEPSPRSSGARISSRTCSTGRVRSTVAGSEYSTSSGPTFSRITEPEVEISTSG